MAAFERSYLRLGGCATTLGSYADRHVRQEEAIFFRDLSNQVLQDDVLARLLMFPNVLVTSHEAFLTHEALANIASTTLANVTAFEHGGPLANGIRAADALSPPPDLVPRSSPEEVE